MLAAFEKTELGLRQVNLGVGPPSISATSTPHYPLASDILRIHKLPGQVFRILDISYAGP
jgi:hypothetical protein